MEDLKKLLAAATPGPWYVGHNKLGDDQGPMSIWPDANMIGAIIARCGPQQPWQGWYEQPAHDAALIVAAINALPELLAKLERYDDALDEIAAHYNGGITGPGRQQADSMRAIARVALETKP
jgi:hypothetical protein